MGNGNNDPQLRKLASGGIAALVPQGRAMT